MSRGTIPPGGLAPAGVGRPEAVAPSPAAMLKPNRIRLDARYGDATDAGIAIEVAGSGEKPVLLSPDIVPTG